MEHREFHHAGFAKEKFKAINGIVGVDEGLQTEQFMSWEIMA